MVWLGRLTGLCALCLLLTGLTGALAADDALPEHTVQAAIAAQPLTQALAAFTASTHLQLVYVSQLALGLNSQTVPAGLPAAAGLARLLEGTGLDFKFLNDRTVKLFERPRRAPRDPPAGVRRQRFRRRLARGGRGISLCARSWYGTHEGISVLAPEDLDSRGHRRSPQ
jgi:hypothetical protein